MKNDDGLDFALSQETGRIVDVTMVASGLACRCVCPECGTPLMAKKGAKYRHHFAHYRAGAVVETCATGQESALHKAARQLIAGWSAIELPELRVAESGYEETLPKRQVQVLRSELPDDAGERGAWSAAGFRPDVVLHGEVEQVWCEVRVTHAVDERKRTKLFGANIATLEFDISAVHRNGVWTLADLDQMLRRDLAIRQWAFHPGEAGLRDRLRRRASSYLQGVRGALPGRNRPADDSERDGLNQYNFSSGLVFHPAFGLIPRNPDERAEFLARSYPEPKVFPLGGAVAFLRHHPHADSTCLVAFSGSRTGDYDAALSAFCRSAGLRCSYFAIPDMCQVAGDECRKKLTCFLSGLQAAGMCRRRADLAAKAYALKTLMTER